MNMQRTLSLVKVQMKKVVREPTYLFLMILFPAMLTLVFGLGFSELESAEPGKSQFEVMAPGLFAYACIFIIMIVAQSFTDDREKGLLKRVYITPTTSEEFMASHFISNTLLALMQVGIVAVCVYLMGYRPKGGMIGYLLAFLFIGCLAIASVGLGLITATISKNAGMATALSFVFIMPQMFFGTFMPLSDTTEKIAQFLPSYYVTDSLTMIFEDKALTKTVIWTNLATLAIISVVIVIIGIQLYKKFSKM